MRDLPTRLDFCGRTRERGRRASFAHSAKAAPVSRIGWPEAREASGIACNVAQAWHCRRGNAHTECATRSANAVLWRKRHKKKRRRAPK